MNAAGIIFSNLHDKNIPELTKTRALASIPFACRYRLIDFALSNMVNCGISNINVITHYNYYSLMDHIGTGKNWDLARRTGGIKILPPYATAYANAANQLYNTRLEALKSINRTITNTKEDIVVLSDCDVVCNIDFIDLIERHCETGADITMVIKSMDTEEFGDSKYTLVSSDKGGKITDIMSTLPGNKKKHRDVFLNIFVMNRDMLQGILNESIARDYSNLERDIIMKNITSYKMFTYRHEGYCSVMSSFNEYYRKSMELVENKENRDSLFNISDRPVLTKVRNSSPTLHAKGCAVKNSLVADGCVIEGSVENSILFRGVRVGRGAAVKNSILFQDTEVGSKARLECVVSDKNVIIREGREIKGIDTMPIHIEKGKTI